jgi:hypothetical protein
MNRSLAILVRTMPLARLVMLSVGLWMAAYCFGQSANSAQQQQSLCRMSDPKCGLPGIALRETSRAIASEIVQQGSNYYFPVSILTAAFGLEPRDYRTLRYPHEITRRQFAFLLSQEKRFFGSNTLDPPALVALDLGQGPKVYDADLLRDLFTTELFPYRMHIKSVKVSRGSGVKLDAVRLERGAEGVVDACLKDIDQINVEGSKCSDAIQGFEEKQGTRSASTAASTSTGHFATGSFGFLPRTLRYLPIMDESDSADRNADAKSRCGENRKSDLARVIECLPAKNTGPVWLQADWTDADQIGPLAFEMLTGAEQQSVQNQKGSKFYRFKFHLYFPRWASSTYKSVMLTVVSPEGKNNNLVPSWTCVPPAIVPKAVEEKMGPLGNPCSSPTSWVFSGRILRPSEDDFNKQPLELLVPVAPPKVSVAVPAAGSVPVAPSKGPAAAPTAESIDLEVTLTGTPILADFFGRFAAYFGQTPKSICWDVPSGKQCPNGDGSH